jgi:hypothetical protein
MQDHVHTCMQLQYTLYWSDLYIPLNCDLQNNWRYPVFNGFPEVHWYQKPLKTLEPPPLNAIRTIIEGHETAFNGLGYQVTTGEPLKNLKPTLNYHENDSILQVAVSDQQWMEIIHKLQIQTLVT